MAFVIIGIILVGIIFLAVFVIKSFAQPKKIDGIKRLVKQQKYAQAQKLAKSIIAKDPRDFVAHYWLGRAYAADNKNDLAFMEFKNIAQNAVFDSSIPEVPFRKQLAELYVRFNQPEEAVNEYLLLTKQDPTNAEHFFNVGKLYEQLGRADMSMGFYQKCLQINPKHVKAHAALGLALFRGKDMRGAQREIDTAIKLDPNMFSTYYYQGKILKESKDYSGAVKAFEKALRDPDFKQRALLERGSCYMMANSIDNAMTEFDRAIKASKNDRAQETLYARYFLAACYEKNRKIDKAIEQWQSIMSVNKGFKDVASKLNEYKDLQTNDSLKEYMTCAQDELIEICKKTAAAMGYATQTAESKKWGVLIIAAEKTEDWKNVRKQMSLIAFFRETNPLDEPTLRNLVDQAKPRGCSQTIICTSSGFTSTATGFAENRPVELVAKEKLEQMLAKAGV